MKQPFPVIGAIIFLCLAAILQSGIFDRYTLLGAHVNLPVVVMLCFGLISRPAAGGGLGLLSGILTGGLSGATLMHYAVSRVLAGYLVGTQSKNEPELRLAVFWVFVGSLISQTVLILLAPPNPLLPAVGATILSAVYNGVVAIPMFALVARLFRPKVV
jgi:LytS/YehU family sensor histidine kinase